MLRQLAALTRPVPRLAAGALAIAVYAEPDGDGGLRPCPAAGQQGHEGVACVDDAARAVVLYCALWRRWRLPAARAAARGLLRFVAAMQDEDGRFTNFILDWDGTRNRTGASSAPGGAWWSARALHAFACGAGVFGDAGLRHRFARGLPWLDQPYEELGPRAVAVLAALEWWEATGDADAARRCLRWAEQLVASRRGDVLPDRLPDAPGSAMGHLWGHLHELALARAGRALDRPDLVAAARRSAAAVLAPPVRRAFTDRATTIPYDVSCAVLGLDAVAQAAGDRQAAHLVALGRAWFGGRNAAQRPVYDRVRGCVYDGIDGDRVSANSGAESNVEGALALFRA